MKSHIRIGTFEYASYFGSNEDLKQLTSYTINRLSHKRLPNGITPYECMHGTRPNISNMRVFGCHAEILIEKQYRIKTIDISVKKIKLNAL